MRSLLKAWVLLFVCAGNVSPQIADSGSGRALVAGGEYTVGSDSSEIDGLMARYAARSAQLFTSETPRRQRVLRPFEIDRIEVTNGAFAEFVEARPEWSRERLRAELHDGDYLAHWVGDAPPDRLREVPVTNITWHAAAFCLWKEMRLPAEAEWEVAARGGLTGEVFPWGASLPNATDANWSRSGPGAPIRGGSYPPNGFGIFDMAGNVWEMTFTLWSDNHPEQPEESASPASMEPPRRVDPEERRVIRGGSYGAAPVNMRVRYRDSHRVSDTGPHVGFRCARSVG